MRIDRIYARRFRCRRYRRQRRRCRARARNRVVLLRIAKRRCSSLFAARTTRRKKWMSEDARRMNQHCNEQQAPPTCRQERNVDAALIELTRRSVVLPAGHRRCEQAVTTNRTRRSPVNKTDLSILSDAADDRRSGMFVSTSRTGSFVALARSKPSQLRHRQRVQTHAWSTPTELHTFSIGCGLG